MIEKQTQEQDYHETKMSQAVEVESVDGHQSETQG
jgi:hypothetical protein